MDLLDRLLQHDAWTTRRLIDICGNLDEAQLDREFDIGHRTLRNTLHHIVRNMEVWSALMLERSDIEPAVDRSIDGLRNRLTAAAEQFAAVARRTADAHAWDELWCDHLDDPPRMKSFGTAIAHVVTHGMHHRAQVLYMLRLSGVEDRPEGDVFSWENAEGHGDRE